jgi:hypothetical protein
LASRRRFVVVTAQRSGSQWLRSLLDSHPEIKASGELFLDRRPAHFRLGGGAVPNFKAFQGGSARGGRVATYRYLRLLSRQAGDVAFGFKIMLSQMRRARGFLVAMRLLGYRAVFLVRNPAETHVSTLVRQRTGVPHSSRPIETPSVRVDPRALLAEIDAQRAGFRRAMRRARALGIPHVVIDYAALRRDPQLECSRIFELLELADRDFRVSSDQVKLVDRPYAEVIENYVEVMAALRAARADDLLAPPRGPEPGLPGLGPGATPSA